MPIDEDIAGEIIKRIEQAMRELDAMALSAEAHRRQLFDLAKKLKAELKESPPP